LTLGCTGETPDTSGRGRVLSQGVPQAGVEVILGDDVTFTDDGGYFTFEERTGPISVVVADGQVITDIGCSDAPYFEVGEAVERPRVPVKLRIDGVVGEPIFHVELVTREGDVRRPFMRRWDLEPLVATPDPVTPRAWNLEVPVPIANGYAIGVAMHRELPNVGVAQGVAQVTWTTGPGPRVGPVQEKTEWASGEMFRDIVDYSGQGPKGFEAVRLTTWMPVDDVLSLPFMIYEGPIVEGPFPLPLLRRTPFGDDPQWEAEVLRNASGACTQRSMAVDAWTGPGRLAGQWREGNDTGFERVDAALWLGEEAFAWPSLRLTGRVRPQLDLQLLEAGTVVDLSLRYGSQRWNLQGEWGACSPSTLELPEPLEPLKSRTVQGELNWSYEGWSGGCTVRW